MAHPQRFYRFQPYGQDPVLYIKSLQINRGERVFIEGPSRSGKTTLLSLMAGVIIPQQGRVQVLEKQIEALRCVQRDQLRSHHIGYIFQMFNLIPYLTMVENVILPCWLSERRRRKALERSKTLEKEAMRLLAHLDMDYEGLLTRPVTELSVGQQQRIAATRALMGAPEILIADEPTSSLDMDSREVFIRLLFDECGKAGSTLIKQRTAKNRC